MGRLAAAAGVWECWGVVSMSKPEWRSEQSVCQHCQHKWVAVCPIETESLECPKCGGYTAIADMDDLLNPPLHLVISRYDGATYLKPSREIDRIQLAGILSEVLFMVNSSSSKTCKPEDCQLRVILSVEKPEDD